MDWNSISIKWNTMNSHSILENEIKVKHFKTMSIKNYECYKIGILQFIFKKAQIFRNNECRHLNWSQ